jgi:hypothetical protein
VDHEDEDSGALALATELASVSAGGEISKSSGFTLNVLSLLVSLMGRVDSGIILCGMPAPPCMFSAGANRFWIPLPPALLLLSSRVFVASSFTGFALLGCC